MDAKKPAGRSSAEEARRARVEWNRSYRGQALKLLPWVCASCGRDFEGKNLSELTVHHKDHDHTNNPSDGSNWELLCYWCHDNEHSRHAVADASAPSKRRQERTSVTSKPFADLQNLLNRDE